MAALNTLRTKGSMLLTVVIGISLLAFLLGDGASLFNSTSVNVGSVNGTEVSLKEYSDEVQNMTSIRQFMTGQSSLQQQEIEAVQGQTWATLINNIALKPAYKALGLNVSDEELLELVNGEEVSPVVTQFFSNPSTGGFDKAVLTNFVSNLDSDPSGMARRFWAYVETQVEDYQLGSKFNNLVKAGMFITDMQIAQEYAVSENNYSFEFVTKSLNTISDDQVTVTDADLKAYYEKHKERFMYGDASEVEYITFDIVPSSFDYQDAEKRSFVIAKELAEAEDVEQYTNYTSEQNFNPTYFNVDELPEYLQKVIVTAKEGQTFDPNFEGESYSIARLNSVKTMPDSIELRSVVLSPSANVDSLLNIAQKSAAMFDSVAVSSSLLDFSTTAAQKINTGTLAPKYFEKLVGAKRGETFVMDGAQGTKQLIRVVSLGKPVKRYQIAEVVFDVVPSNQTEQEIYQKATDFANSIAEGKSFEEAVADNQFIKRNTTVNVTDRDFANLEGARELVRWSFTAEEGTTSTVVTAGSVNIVAFLKKKMSKGLAPFEEVKEDVRPLYIAKAKMDMAINEISNTSSLESLASQLGVEVNSAVDINFSDFAVPGIGMAPEVIGAMTQLNDGQISKGIAAGSSAAVIKVSNKSARDGYNEEKVRLLIESNNEQYLENRIAAALVKIVEIKDNRVIYY